MKLYHKLTDDSEHRVVVWCCGVGVGVGGVGGSMMMCGGDVLH